VVSTGLVRGYEALSALLVIAGLGYVVRRRNPLYAGLYLGSAVGGGVFEWIFDTRWYFNLTSDPRLVPLWRIDGVPAPLAMVFFYTFFFGIPLILLLEHSAALFDRFGRAGFFALLAVGAAVGVLAFEGFNTSVMGVYAYHQAPRFLLLGMPWSNLWFSPLIFCFAFWAALRSRDVLDVVAAAGTPDTPAGTRAARPATAVALGSAVLVTGLFAAATLNGVWYALARPWLESGRPF
jgi:hypothetical protein